MATSVGLDYNSLDLVEDYVCSACESKNIWESSDYFCATCMKYFCRQCIYFHDQLYANHCKYGREEREKWPFTKTVEDLLLKCDVHKDKKLKTFCHDHSQLCCTDCVLLHHRLCTNVALISESVQNMSVDMQQLSINLHTILDELNKFKCRQDASIQSVEASWSEKLKEIKDLRNKLNADLDELENKTLKELDEIRVTLQTSLKEDVDNYSRLEDEFQALSDAVHVLCDKSEKEVEFIASRKCLDKIQEYESYLKKMKKNPVKLNSPIIFMANGDIQNNLSQQTSLGRIINLKIQNPDQEFTVKRKLEYYTVRTWNDTKKTCNISGICCLPSGEIIVTDYDNKIQGFFSFFGTRRKSALSPRIFCSPQQLNFPQDFIFFP
ncbi:E3 ubiquitin-protein ligase TRIM33-like [Dreissena polymorpha]|uniref:B box-type domain-containing protein n=1 Tax=Dreissena polymorpha TaxID=45954 RepID=A0A9D4J244_DREPO|nr:E3 ubiquitin-protein ligase TRIM33-like [Dreissena polymorpha]KAH3796926.1 hypothetical protein DPMN_150503 [Dreissena polymorpha]